MMSLDREPLYWYDFKDEWINYDVETEKYSVKPDAPERIKNSFAMWKKMNPKRAA
jgi:hypothetical protein